MMTQTELHDELWLLTKGILQDSRMDTTEASVIKRWLEEHQSGDEFKSMIDKLAKFLSDRAVSDVRSVRTWLARMVED